ncbi:hypothetical protein ACOACO_01210 [Nocardioides sp. CPCC 205120]|uniref:hypothetical protein n=1 Tax=Nocardioides sp. CPCC 205120 TaxID=3406462 RepID=UPI003B510859
MSNWNPDPSSSQPGQPTPPPYGSQHGGQSGANPPGAYQGAPFNGGAYGGPTGSLKRPGTVTAAVFLTFISTVLAGLGALAMIVFAIVGADAFEDEVRKEIENNADLRQQLEDAGADAGDIGSIVDFALGFLITIAVILLIWCIIAFVLAIFAGRGSNGARITLVVSCVVTILGTLILAGAGLPLVFTLAALATIVLFFTGGANSWYKNKKIAKLQGR